MWGVYPEAVDWNIALHTWIFLGECIWSEIPKEHFESLKTYNIGPIGFGIKVHICLPKSKSECAAQ